MTLLIPTLSHGTIEGGFYASFGDFFGLGSYSFLTPHLWKLSREFAEQPTLLVSKLLTYEPEKAGRRFEEHLHNLLQKANVAMASGGGSMTFVPFEVTKPRLEDEVNMDGDGTEIPVRINKGCRSLNIGEYKLSGLEFGGVLYYACNGGHLGWPKGTEPEEARTTLEMLTKSSHPIYRDLQRRLLQMASRSKN